MADEFDLFLAHSLAPAERLPDRRFVARVQARILLEEQLVRERRALIAALAKQIVALIAVAAAIWVIASAAPVADLFAQSPALALAILLVAFSFVVAMFSTSARSTGPSVLGS